MNYVDATLIRLADPATRSAVFDNLALEQLVNTAYNTDVMPVEGPFNPIFDEFRLGLSVPKLGTVEGGWNALGGSERMEARFQIAGMGNGEHLRVDALWRGAIVVRTALAAGRIATVTTAWPDPATIDADIVDALGALPADPQELEQERRARFLAKFRAALDQPAVLTDTAFDAWLSSVGAASVSDLMMRLQGVVQRGAVQVAFTESAPGPPSPMPLPITAALLIRDGGFSVADLLMESKLVREQLEPLGLEPARDPALKVRASVLVVWVVPQRVFDDADWPGGNGGMDATALQTARRGAAGRWLAREGIGLVVTA